jgi:hypothetical protein
VLDGDPDTRAVFARVLEDEVFHMSYTQKQLARLAPRKYGFLLWRERARRLGRAYLRAASGLASLLGAVMLGIQYFLVLPPFALLAKRGARREPAGFFASRARSPLRSQY